MSAPSPARIVRGEITSLVEDERAALYQQPQPRLQIGRLLVDAGLISDTQLAEALRKQIEWGSKLGDTILGMGWVKPLDFYRVLARQLSLDFVNLLHNPADESLFEKGEYANYAQELYLPWRRVDGILWIATADPLATALASRWASRTDIRFVVTSKFDIIWDLQRVAGAQFSEEAVLSLAELDPEHSARTVVTPNQKWWLAGLPLLLLISTCMFPLPTLIVLNTLINGLLFCSFVFRTCLCWMSCDDNIGIAIQPEEVAALHDADLPLYTVLVPMYKEPTVLPILVAALRRMDYPKSKL
jgi:hypothetical protein